MPCLEDDAHPPSRHHLKKLVAPEQPVEREVLVPAPRALGRGLGRPPEYCFGLQRRIGSTRSVGCSRPTSVRAGRGGVRRQPLQVVQKPGEFGGMLRVRLQPIEAGRCQAVVQGVQVLGDENVDDVWGIARLGNLSAHGRGPLSSARAVSPGRAATVKRPTPASGPSGSPRRQATGSPGALASPRPAGLPAVGPTRPPG